MLTTVLTILPIFAIIAAGYACRRGGILGATAASEFNRFVVYLALPALLFDVMAGVKWSAIWQPGFIVAFSAGTFGIFAIAFFLRLRRGQPAADAAIDGLNAGYANAGFVGFPVCEAVFGRESLALATIAAVITVCALFAVAMVIIEVGLQSEARPHHVALKVGRSLARNPLLISPIAGLAWAMTGLPIPAPMESLLHMLGGTATTCALMSLGLFLANGARAQGRPDKAVLAFSGLKLVGQPALTAVVAYGVLHLPPVVAGMAVLMAALPTGTGPFMLAEYYDREAVATSQTILITNALSVITLAVCIALIR
ncbi:hypothetical protein GCM10007301_44850 [Azorhizobium oxalatiphilum]|uniref:Transporter n=1 Tax=Azorhizobium oxalatiphilum TaxID=980631 RepID=A0A917CC48_9HYPH|nr:AEC family transporter [Azorhizobium oxalatiphilum]GGF79788.1 hypothetical protein GCM10007301_44850 [Azorhizobium oxalatiphilum]